MNPLKCLLLLVLLPAFCSSCKQAQNDARSKIGSARRTADRAFAQKGDTLSGRAVKIVDGDTFDLLDEDQKTTRIRMSGIDAPEKKQAFGQKSKEAFGALLDHPPLTVVVRDRDRYSRAVCDIYAGDSWVNLEMVKGGWAWHYTDYSKDRQLAAAETAARALGAGLWADSRPTPPWDYRKEKRKPKKGARTAR